MNKVEWIAYNWKDSRPEEYGNYLIVVRFFHRRSGMTGRFVAVSRFGGAWELAEQDIVKDADVNITHYAFIPELPPDEEE